MMNMQQMLGESGRTMSNVDRAIMSDNEPRMQERDQAFSIEADIQNLMKSYNMLVEAQDFQRAQQVATMIDQLQQQKIGVQAQNVPQEDDISRILDSISI
jgi:hypothetical protein